jgi:hypothetical protein
LLSTKAFDARPEFWIGIEEVDAHRPGACDRTEVDLGTVFDQSAQTAFGPLDRCCVFGRGCYSEGFCSPGSERWFFDLSVPCGQPGR